MLVLSRQRDESIVIGDEIEITVVDIRGDKVRLGISAPREIQVHRKEVYEAIKRENTDASRVQIDDLTRMNGNLRAGGVRRPLPGNGSGRPLGPPLAGPATPGVPNAAALPGSVPGPVPGNGQR